jgi:predicted SAM-dependent methyltransferase
MRSAPAAVPETRGGSPEIRRAVRRLNWGCGPSPAPGWVNADRRAAPGVELVGDIRDGLAAPDGAFDYATSIHALQELPCLDLVPALRELRRVLRPGGWIRLALPDLERAIRAYLRQDAGYFFVPDDDARSLGGKLNIQMTWYGSSRSLFTADYTEELLRAAGFTAVHRCRFRQTRSPYPEIVELDDRERETLFTEAEP